MLLIEDSDISARLILEQLVLGLTKVRVKRATTLDEGTRLLTSDAWDVVLTDLGLPDSDGLETVQRLRAVSRTIPIVVLTANDDEELANEALEEQVQDFLVKRAMDPEVLARTVRYAIGRQRIVARLEATASDAKRSEEHLHQLLTRSADGIVVFDDSGIVRFANIAAAELLAKPEAPLLGSRVDGIPLDREHSEVEFRTDADVRVLDVRIVSVDWRAEPAKMAMIRDVTDRRNAEALRLHLERAERLVSVGTLAASVAHEINNPLAYVIMNLELLDRELRKLESSAAHPVSNLRSHVASSLDGTQRVSRIVSDLAAYARETPVESPKPTDLGESVRSALTIARSSLTHRAALDVQLGDVPEVRGDPGRLCQVFVNLLVNAAHAIEESPGQRHSLVVRSYVDCDDAIVEIRDTGVGIPDAVRSHLFEPFFTTRQRKGGTGLGLYVCRNIVRSFGGSIDFDPASSVGTTVRVRVPLWSNGLAPTESPSRAESRAATNRRRVLIVDDEPNLLRSLSALVGESHEVVPCTSGNSAKNLLANDPDFDVILCDVVMADGTGPELFAWVESNAPRLRKRFVFMTGGGVEANRTESARTGIPILTKPFTMRDLFVQIEKSIRDAYAGDLATQT